ncbi:putative P-type ATPase [Trypanosoma theileri]|uniref:Calcium-transporting ATPase n=1 Tax=Trypanosoma theileri TaxID=67003 RepID=A0A1X0NTI6_9TRYP|nr:putative P-type ATPase [Trypanosoma theileri]ORC87793.1 putative P-type ATPase [Trypanosoma theileri]
MRETLTTTKTPPSLPIEEESTATTTTTAGMSSSSGTTATTTKSSLKTDANTFGVDAETLHSIVTDSAGGPHLLKSFGGVRGLAKLLRTDLLRGLPVETAEALQARRAAFSVNELPPAAEVTFMDLVWDSLGDRMMQLLMISAVTSLLLGLTVPDVHTGRVDYAHGWIEGAAILLSVAIVTLVSSLNNYQKEQKFKELMRDAPAARATVIRAGAVVETTDKELLVGDLLNVAGGDVLTVDGLVVHSNAFKVDESSATGENDDVAKDAVMNPFVLSGSNVVEGDATILVTGVGINSFAGRISMQVRKESEETPLQEKLTELADKIGNCGVIAAALMFAVLSIRELWVSVMMGHHPLHYKPFLDSLTTAVTIVVVAVPEGLPLSVTIALAYSMKQMFKEKNLVRHLVACETMGSATTICTDKTGTITQNAMTVTDGITAEGVTFSLTGNMDRDEMTLTKLFTSASPLRSLLAESISVNSTAAWRRVEDAVAHTSAVRLTGNKTEQAMLTFVNHLGEDSMTVRAKMLEQTAVISTTSPNISSPSLSSVTPSSAFNNNSNNNNNTKESLDNTATQLLAHEKEMRSYPFSSARKRMTTALALRKKGVIRYYVKGASELVLANCTYGLQHDGCRVPLSSKITATLQDAIMDMSRRRLRTIAVAYVDEPLKAEKDADSSTRVEQGKKIHSLFPPTDEHLPPLTLIAILGIRDPVRPEVPNAVSQCRRAGIFVRLITGDNKATAVSVAREVGIYGRVWSGPAAGEQGLALEGPQFREFAKSARKLNQILPRLQVISRASPLDKQILVAELMKRGEVVAVTGDGTNDAPALKNAHVGFSMNAGTEVAKNASDVVILDDNFSTIVTAIKWGRNVHDNISKFLQFQMTVNVAAVIFSFIGATLSGSDGSPLKPVQLLWLNLIMDTLAALALATESPRDTVLDRSPRGREAPLITQRMWSNIIGQSLYQVILQLWVLHSGYTFFNVQPGSEEHLTIVFNVFVLLQLFNEFNARILDGHLNIFTGLERAPLFLLIVGLTFIIQVIGVQYGGPLMQAVPLSSAQWGRCFLVSSIPTPLGLLLRALPVKEKSLPPPPVVVDPEEEEKLKNMPPRKRMTLREAAQKVITELKVAAIFTDALSSAKNGKKHR